MTTNETSRPRQESGPQQNAAISQGTAHPAMLSPVEFGELARLTRIERLLADGHRFPRQLTPGDVVQLDGTSAGVIDVRPKSTVHGHCPNRPDLRIVNACAVCPEDVGRWVVMLTPREPDAGPTTV